jgi:hypothetical protein
MIVIAPDKRPTLPTVDVSFTLTEEDLNWITRTANALGSPNIAVKSDGDEVFLNTFDSNDDSTHTNDVLIPNIESQGKKFKLVFKTENLKILPGNYLVEICSKGLAKFTGTTDNNITYYVTLETSSTYA